MTFHNIVTNTGFILLLIIEFIQLIGFLFYKLTLAPTTTSSLSKLVVTIGNKTNTYTQNVTSSISLSYVSYFNVKQLLESARNSITSTQSGQTISYVVAGLALIIIAANFVQVAILCKYAKDGYDALFSTALTKLMLKICGVIQTIFLKVIFLPLLMILLSILICTTDQKLQPLNKTDPRANISFNYYYGNQCWNISHLILSIICILFALAMTALFCLFSLLYNDIRFHSKVPWGSSSIKGELIKTVIKILIAVALNIEMYNKWALLVCQCGNIVLVYLLLHSRWKYSYQTDRKVMIVTLLQESSYFWLSIVVTLINVASLLTISYSLFIYILISAVAFAILVLTTILNSKDSHHMLFRLPHLKHDYELEQFYFRLIRHVCDNKIANIDKIVIYGLIKNHQKNAMTRCQDPKCHCEQLMYMMSKNKLEAHLEQLHEMALERQSLFHRSDPKYNYDKVKQSKKDLENKQFKRYDYKFRRLFFKFFYGSLCKRVETQFPKSMRLKFFQVQILQNELSNEFKSYFQTLKLLRDKPSLEYQYFLYQSKQSVEHIMYRKYQSLLTNKQTLDVVKVYEFEDLFIKFEQKVINTANNCLNFWKELMDKRLDVNRIHDSVVQISNSFQEVNDITHQMTRLFQGHVMFQRIYASFLCDVMNNENEAQDIFARVRAQLENQNNMYKLNYMNEDKFFGYNTGTVIITITVTPRDIGNIQNANFETKKMLGYRHKDLKGKNVRILMPKILQDNHDSFLQNYFETAKAKILERQRIVIAKDKEGYIVPCFILVKAIPNLKQNLTFVGFLRKMDDTHTFMQPPTQYSSLDYHMICATTEGEIYGFTRNCWETFGFKPAFFFNQFGDPEQQIRIEYIIKGLKDPNFMNKPELKKEGAFCTLDTGVVMENAPRELLSKEEQELMMSISGSYNINLQIEEMNFSNNKIQLRIYKIIKVSRIIRSQNAFVEKTMSFESQEIESEETISIQKPTLKSRLTKRNGLKISGRLIESDNIQHNRIDQTDNDCIDQNDVSIFDNDETNNLKNKASIFENSDDSRSSHSSTTHSQSQQLINFKKQISTRDMPQSIIKLNRLVLLIFIIILAVGIFQTIQNYQYYQFAQQSEQILQNLFQKHYLIGKISSNVITMGLINMGLQDNSYMAFVNRSSNLRDKLLNDIKQLEAIESSIQNSAGSTSFGFYGITSGNNAFNCNPGMSMTTLNQDATLLADNTQTMRYAISQLISKVGSLLQNTTSYSTILLPPELSIVIEQNDTVPNRSNLQKAVFFIVYNSLRDLTTVTLQQISNFNQEALINCKYYHWLLTAGYVCSCFFIILSGFVIFPIVVGVQRNKVMILSIYFDLPMTEIKAVHERCFAFLCKIDDERRNEALMMAAAGQVAEESKGDQDNENSTHREDLSISSNRNLVSNNITRTRFKKNSKKVSVNNKDNKKGKGDDLVHHSDEIKNNSDESEKDEHSPLDRDKMLKDIKISNNKLNGITLSVILLFLTFFSISFGISLNFMNSIFSYVTTNTKLYSEQPSLQYTYLYFLTDILLDRSQVSLQEQTRYQSTVAQVYELLEEREEAKKAGVGWLSQIDNSTFCTEISPFVDTSFEQNECESMNDGLFTLGYRNSIFSFMYQFHQLRVQYDHLRKNQTTAAMTQKLKFLNNPTFIQFSVLSNAYYQAEVQGLNTNQQATLSLFFKQAILFVELKITFFVIFSFIIAAFLWRVFVGNIQAEVFRSKGMLNMIPTAFLEKDNNLRKLSLNKLLNLS